MPSCSSHWPASWLCCDERRTRAFAGHATPAPAVCCGASPARIVRVKRRSKQRCSAALSAFAVVLCCLPALPACVPACVPARVPACVPACCVRACLRACLCVRVCVRAWLPSPRPPPRPCWSALCAHVPRVACPPPPMRPFAPRPGARPESGAACSPKALQLYVDCSEESRFINYPTGARTRGSEEVCKLEGGGERGLRALLSKVLGSTCSASPTLVFLFY